MNDDGNVIPLRTPDPARRSARRHPSGGRADHVGDEGGTTARDEAAVLDFTGSSDEPTGPAAPRRADLAGPAGRRAGVPAPPHRGRLPRRRVRLRPRADRGASSCRAFRTLYDRWFRVEVNGIEHMPGDGRRAARRQPRRRAVAARRGDDRGGRPRRAPRRSATCARSAPTCCSPHPVRERWPARTGATLACPPTPSGCCERGSWSGSGRRVSRASASRSASGTSCSASAAAGSCTSAIKTGVPIVPVSIVGSEEIHPVLAQRHDRWPGCSACRTSRSRRRSRGSGRSASSRCRASGTSSSARPIDTDVARGRTRPTTRCVVFELTDRVRETDPDDALPAARPAPLRLALSRTGTPRRRRDAASAAQPGQLGVARAAVQCGAAAPARPRPATDRASADRAGTPMRAALRPVRKSRISQPRSLAPRPAAPSRG